MPSDMDRRVPKYHRRRVVAPLSSADAGPTFPFEHGARTDSIESQASRLRVLITRREGSSAIRHNDLVAADALGVWHMGVVFVRLRTGRVTPGICDQAGLREVPADDRS